jgi:hypothetical protein
VSKAKEDLPEPLMPVTVTSLFLGIMTSIFLRLCSRAPKTSILSCPVSSMSESACFANIAGSKSSNGKSTEIDLKMALSVL